MGWRGFATGLGPLVVSSAVAMIDYGLVIVIDLCFNVLWLCANVLAVSLPLKTASIHGSTALFGPELRHTGCSQVSADPMCPA